jgi:hypothetical protein
MNFKFSAQDKVSSFSIRYREIQRASEDIPKFQIDYFSWIL